MEEKIHHIKGIIESLPFVHMTPNQLTDFQIKGLILMFGVELLELNLFALNDYILKKQKLYDNVINPLTYFCEYHLANPA